MKNANRNITKSPDYKNVVSVVVTSGIKNKKIKNCFDDYEKYQKMANEGIFQKAINAASVFACNFDHSFSLSEDEEVDNYIINLHDKNDNNSFNFRQLRKIASNFIHYGIQPIELVFGLDEDNLIYPKECIEIPQNLVGLDENYRPYNNASKSTNIFNKKNKEYLNENKFIVVRSHKKIGDPYNFTESLGKSNYTNYLMLKQLSNNVSESARKESQTGLIMVIPGTGDEDKDRETQEKISRDVVRLRNGDALVLNDLERLHQVSGGKLLDLDKALKSSESRIIGNYLGNSELLEAQSSGNNAKLIQVYKVAILLSIQRNTVIEAVENEVIRKIINARFGRHRGVGLTKLYHHKDTISPELILGFLQAGSKFDSKEIYEILNLKQPKGTEMFELANTISKELDKEVI